MNSFNLKLKEAAKANHIDKEISSHIFRHSHVSLLSELGMPLKSIMERVGHSDAKVTLKIYNHVTKKAKKILLMHLTIYKKRTCYKTGFYFATFLLLLPNI
ncbi:Tyrosine recombinase XerD [Lactococcus lactis]|nr:Tyrosine recombinase XerD [Lactococcus lactis]